MQCHGEPLGEHWSAMGFLSAHRAGLHPGTLETCSKPILSSGGHSQSEWQGEEKVPFNLGIDHGCFSFLHPNTDADTQPAAAYLMKSRRFIIILYR
jgi:hypothetical protein